LRSAEFGKLASVYPRVFAQYPTLVVFVASIALLTPQADARRADTPCQGRPPAVGVGAAPTLQPTHEPLTVGSLNMAADARNAEILESWTRDRSMDVLFLQEVGDDGVDGRTLISTVSTRLGFAFAYAPANVIDGVTEGLAIVSRYSLSDIRVHPVQYHRLPFRSRCRVALGATVATPDGPVRLVNVHLDTRINSDSRIAQLTPALDVVGTFDGPRIIGGDLNTMNVRWVWGMLPLFYLSRQSDAVRTWMSSRGFDTPFTDTPPTLRFPIVPMRVDWLYLKDVEPLAWGVDHMEFSDHRGIWAHVDPKHHPL
jgi:endonuclease/exonuclease/phosphatase family metal-dependent hydrolase